MGVQAAVLAVAASVAWLWGGLATGSALLYGGAVALGNTGFLTWRWWRGLTDYRSDGQYHLKTFHRSSLERFFIVAIFLAVGLVALKLAPLPLLAGFVLGLLSWVIAIMALKTE